MSNYCCICGKELPLEYEKQYCDECASKWDAEEEKQKMKDPQYLLDLYNKCLNAKYITVENNADYAIERDGNTVYLLFECTDSNTDWKNNFSFFAKPYKDMEPVWRCHRGFLKVWKSIQDYLKDVVFDMSVEKIIIVGYSHGAAIATLCHEYVWFNRPDLRYTLEGYGFGCPRCYFGRMNKQLKARWENFTPIRNLNDIVTHVPPRAFGFRHVNKVMKIGTKGELVSTPTKLNCVNAHLPANYTCSLEDLIK